jgi:hypothetical protein
MKIIIEDEFIEEKSLEVDLVKLETAIKFLKENGK